MWNLVMWNLVMWNLVMWNLVAMPLFLLSCNAYTYNETIAKIAVNLSQASYCVSKTSSWTCATCDHTNTLEDVIETHGERSLLGYNTELDSLFVVFRGSTNIQNWIDNIQVRKIYPYNNTNIGVEKGFYKAYQNIKTEVFQSLDTLKEKYTTDKLLITAHSLGAAIGSLMVLDTMHIYDVTLYTFGSPRVGNEYFVDLFRSLHTKRISHYYDAVPHLPPESLGFLHIPQEIWYNEENTKYVMCNDDVQQEDPLCSDSCAPLHCTSTSDHLNYLQIPMGSSNGLC